MLKLLLITFLLVFVKCQTPDPWPGNENWCTPVATPTGKNIYYLKQIHQKNFLF